MTGISQRVRLTSSAGAVALGVGWLAIVAANCVVWGVEHQLTASNAFGNVAVLPFLLVGVVVARQQPGNAIGWLLIALALTVSLGGLGGAYAVLAYRDGHHALPLARLGVVLAPGWAGFIVLLPFPLLLFPDGRVVSRRGRRILVAGLLLCGVFLASIAALDLPALWERHVHVDSGGTLVALDNTSGLIGVIGDVLLVGYVAFCLAVVIHQVIEYRRSTGAKRAQLKWLVSGGAIALVGLVIAIEFAGPSFILVAGLPIAIGVGVLRYRLYEIDRLISRTLSYAILTAVLVGMFIGLIALTTDTLALSGRVGVAASTLAAAAMFNPLRIRVQRLVDRRFNRARYDAEAIAAAFTTKLRDAVEIDTIRADLLAAVNRAVEPDLRLRLDQALTSGRPRTSHLARVLLWPKCGRPPPRSAWRALGSLPECRFRVRGVSI